MRTAEIRPTGITGLDTLLRGGLRKGTLVLVVGDTGAGKTVLAHQIASNEARQGRTALYCTTLIESHQTLLAQARTFSFFDPATVSHSLYYASLQPALSRGGVSEVRAELLRLTRERSPDLIVIDGMQTLHVMAGGRLEFHRLMVDLQAQTAATGTTMMLLSNPIESPGPDPRMTAADAIIELGFHVVPPRRLRTAEVRKHRGVHIIEGIHGYVIEDSGMRIHPRLEALVARERIAPPDLSAEVLPTGMRELDGMVGGGLSRGSLTLVSGVTGAGKTLFALSFLNAGAAAGEPALFVGFHESPDELAAKGRGVGLPIAEHAAAGLLQVQWRPSADLFADEILDDVLEAVRRHGIRRLAIDGLDDILRSLFHPERAISMLNAFANLLRAEGVCVVITQESSTVAGSEVRLPLTDLSAAVDNIILFRYAEIASELRRLIAVLKMREREHDFGIRELRIDGEGLHVGARFKSAEDLLSGSAHWMRPDE